MAKLFWFVLGLGGGFVLAHLVDKDPRGHELLGEVDARITEFTERIGDAYRAQESKLSDAIDQAKDAAASAVDAARVAASDAVDSVSSVARSSTD